MEYLDFYDAEGNYLGCVSNINGAVIISDTLAFIDRKYKTPGSETVFAHNAKILRYLSDENLRKVLQYEYKENFSDCKAMSKTFTLEEISEGCGLSLEDTENALELLILLKLNETVKTADRETTYHFVSQNALYAFVIFKVVEMMTEDKCWLVIRDTSIVSDYAFNEA